MNTSSILKRLNINTEYLNAYSAGLLQGKAYRTLNSHLTKTLMPFDLSIPEWKLLGQLHDHGNMGLAELADILSVEPPLITKLIDHLEKKGYVERVLHETDKRSKIIIITKTGDKALMDLEPKVKEVMGTLVKGASKLDMLAYVRVLETIVNNG